MIRRLLLVALLIAAAVTTFFVFYHPPMRLMPVPLVFGDAELWNGSNRLAAGAKLVAAAGEEADVGDHVKVNHL
jgi:hypothetical protein